MTTVRFPYDPEPLTLEWIDGMPSFSKPGPYLGEKFGGRCLAKDRPQNMAVYYDCPLPSGDGVLIREVKATVPTSDALLLAMSLPHHPQSAVGNNAIVHLTAGDMAALYHKQAYHSHPPRTDGGPVLPVQLSAIPLPTSWTLMLAVLVLCCVGAIRRSVR